MRYFSKFDQGTNQRVFQAMYMWFFDQLRFDNFTVDMDSTVMSRYGQQEGARRGYNPHKPGRNSHHPLLAFIADCRMVANCWLRSGDAYTSNNFQGFLEDTLDKLTGKKVGLLRADSGFYSREILEYLERGERPIPYIIAVRLYPAIQRMLSGHRQWIQLGDGVEVADSYYESPGWGKARRMIMVRQKISVRPKATGKSLRLFPDDDLYGDYRYGCFVTSLELPAGVVWKIYRMRADAENRIKELKYDFGAGSFNVRQFSATEAAMNFVMLAYNLMSLFRQIVLSGKVQPTLKTMRYKLFSIAGYLTKEGSARILKLSLAMKRREWFTGLWNKSRSFDLPIQFASHL
ncbi:MAG: IS1380 family transposase [Candidatus Magnetominusculus sp. LBB02]|nr:IS1380 family transposase [Candidatus Magnetominusculus sp. LBB02]